ncbi:Di-sulfide bridge nucleocytoplasmic transport domain-containing protein [Scheffersomyces coipomensis]|uniref:Di-sulfide bridge nucleocytoplasmic transport domain-containing protein n=1 Tax=Scheffersomyces coipomensis TaxID=1788519 RepID=UPI00315D0985
MVDDSSSFGFSILEKPVSPITKDGIRSNSTPKTFIDGENSPIDPTYIQVDYNEEIRQQSTPSVSNQPNLHSILKSSPSNGIQEGIDTSLSDSLLDRHPELKLARGKRGYNPVKGARVIFSPTKEILSYRTDYFEDGADDNSSYLRNIKQKHNVYHDSLDDENEETEDQLSLDLTKEVMDKSQLTNNGNSNKLVNRLMTDANIPYVLSLYLQLLVNLLLISIVLYLIYIFITTIKEDINQKLSIYISDAIEEISLCSREYYSNKCSIEDGNKRVPALEPYCTEWSKCMNRDPQLIGKSKLTAETFADIINGFVKPLSWKSLFVITLLLFGSLIITNVAFGTYRSASHVKDQNQSPDDNDKKIQLLELRLKEQEMLLLEYRNGSSYNDQASAKRNSFKLESPSHINRYSS